MKRDLITELTAWKSSPLRKPLLLLGARQVRKTWLQQELRAVCRLEPYYWASSNGQSEINFLVQQGMELVPLEVKAELNLTAKSLKFYCQKFAPAMAIRTSMARYHVQRIPVATGGEYTQLDIPLYALSQMGTECSALAGK